MQYEERQYPTRQDMRDEIARLRGELTTTQTWQEHLLKSNGELEADRNAVAAERDRLIVWCKNLSVSNDSLTGEVLRLRDALEASEHSRQSAEEGYRIRCKYQEAAESELAKYRAMDTCCCGSPMDSHTMGDGHPPVSEFFYHMDCVETENRLYLKALDDIGYGPWGETEMRDIACEALKKGDRHA